MMEPKTSLKDPNTLKLANPGKWATGWNIIEFLEASETLSLLELRQVRVLLNENVTS